MKISIAYTDTCLPDYFRGDSRPWITIPVNDNGFTSRQLREEILNEFAIGAIGGYDSIAYDYIQDEKEQIRAEKFYKKLRPTLNRIIKFRGKVLKEKQTENSYDDVPQMHIVFDIEE